MPKVTEEYRVARRDEIASAAIRAFARKGFATTSMADIIAESGLSAGAIYGNFANKAELVQTVAERILGGRLSELEAARRASALPSPGELVGVIMAGIVAEVGSPSMLVQVWGAAMTDPALKTLAQRIMGRLTEAFADHISLWHQREHGLSESTASARAAEQTPLFVAACQGYILHSALLPDFDSNGYLTSVAKNLPR
jgi:AcrR family transcriptional regulator